MPKLENIFDQITSIKTLRIANNRSLKGKRYNRFATGFSYDLMSNLISLQQELINKAYRPEDYRHKIIFEPKVRLIEAPSYRDRIVHHSIYHFLNPFYEKYFIPDSYACRINKGIHKAVKKVQIFLNTSEQDLYVCQIDVSKYYASINHIRLLELLKNKINDKRLINLLEIIINSTDSGTEHDHLFASNSYYFTKGRRGIQIGNLTSQLFANIYLHEVDMYAKQNLKIRQYIRYMDDILIFHHDKSQLQIWQNSITSFMYENLYLTVNPRKIRTYPAHHGVSFVGYIIYPNFLRLRGSSVKRFKKRYNKQLCNIADGKTEPKNMIESFTAWKAHASHAKTKNLIKTL
jgi:retron-type reverse transcriptase